MIDDPTPLPLPLAGRVLGAGLGKKLKLKILVLCWTIHQYCGKVKVVGVIYEYYK